MKLNIQLFADGGKVVIETELDTTGFDKGVDELSRKTEKTKEVMDKLFGSNGENKEIEFDIDISKFGSTTQEIENSIKELKNEWNGLNEAADKYEQQLRNILASGSTFVQNGPNSPLYAGYLELSDEDIAKYKEIEALQEPIINKMLENQQIREQLSAELQKQEKTEEDIVEKTNEWVNGVMTLANGTQIVKKNTEETQKNVNGTDFSSIKSSIDGIGKSITGVTKKVGRWALAVFGIRSAYLFVRQAMSTLSQYDDQLATNVEYIRYLLATTLKPLIESLVDLAYRLLNYINAIAQAWFGVNLFARASKKEFEKNKNAIKGTNKSAKELQKTLAGFDEMNILQKDGSTKVGGGGGGISTPFPEPKEVKIPSWMEWIIKHKDEVISAILGIATALTLLKLGLSPLMSLGIGIALGGILYTIQKIKKFIDDPCWKNLLDILIGISVTVLGIGIAIGSLPVAIIGAVGIIVLTITKNFDKIMTLFNKLQKWIETDFFNKMVNNFGVFGGIVATLFSSLIGHFKGLFEGIFGGIKKQAEGVVKFFKGDFKGGLKDVFAGLKDIFLAPINALRQAINSLIRGINKIKFDVPKWVPGIGGNKWGFNLPQIPKLAKGGIVNMPGRGIPYGGATIAEKAPEGIVPLTDTQQMALLGEAIGKFVRIDNIIDVNMDSRKIKRIMATSDDRNRMVGNGYVR